MKFRVSKLEDVPQLKQLWNLAFGDGDSYVDNFFGNYGSPDKILVAEEKGTGKILAMTAWFGSDFHRGGEVYRFAYLYAVATHPEYEKQGIASKLLSFVYETMVEYGFHGVTTVPAQPSLHQFFGRNGFEEYFVHREYQLKDHFPYVPDLKRRKLTAEEYKWGRETYFKSKKSFYQRVALDRGQSVEKVEAIDIPFISLDKEGYEYQNAVCHLGGGGFYALGCTDWFEENREVGYDRFTFASLLTLEQYDTSTCIVKELLGRRMARRDSGSGIEALAEKIQCKSTMTVRRPYFGEHENLVPFGMIQWLTSVPVTWKRGKGGEVGYLGLAFD